METAEKVNSGISDKQELAIAAMLAEPNVRRAAAAAHIGEATLWRWLKDDKFRRAYQDARRRALHQANAQYQSYASEAATVTRELMNDKSQSGSTRLAAARSITQNALQGFEMEEYDQRLEALEQHVEETSDVPKF
jgi:HD-like signal output (HDOD) protein